MSARQAIIDLLSMNSTGMEFDAIQIDTGLMPELLESLLSNMRRNKVVKCLDGNWYLCEQTVKQVQREIFRPDASSQKVIDIDSQKLKKDVQAQKKLLQRIKKRIDAMVQEMELLRREVEKYERSTGLSA